MLVFKIPVSVSRAIEKEMQFSGGEITVQTLDHAGANDRCLNLGKKRGRPWVRGFVIFQ